MDGIVAKEFVLGIEGAGLQRLSLKGGLGAGRNRNVCSATAIVKRGIGPSVSLLGFSLVG